MVPFSGAIIGLANGDGNRGGFVSVDVCTNLNHRAPLLLQVTLFKRSLQHVQLEHSFENYTTVSRGNPNYFITYGNGKSAARVQKGLRPNGAHRWFNYFKSPMCDIITAFCPYTINL